MRPGKASRTGRREEGGGERGVRPEVGGADRSGEKPVPVGEPLPSPSSTYGPSSCGSQKRRPPEVYPGSRDLQGEGRGQGVSTSVRAFKHDA